MRAVVFTDSALASEAGRFVWLEINTERPENAYVLEKYPLRALPTYFIVEPDSEQIALRWVGGATVPSLKKILDDGHSRVTAAWLDPSFLAGDAVTTSVGKSTDASKGTDPMGQLLAELIGRADQLYAAEDDSAAAVNYLAAIDMAPDDWPSYGRAVESALFCLSNSGNQAAILKLSVDAWPRLKDSSSAPGVAMSGLDAAANLPAATPDRDRHVKEFEAACRRILTDKSIPTTGDDKSGIYITLIGARDALGDSVGARALTREWADFLDKEAESAPTPEARTVFDSHRLSAYLELGEPEKAIAFLEKSERDLPDDYNPPARLAAVYKAMKDYPRALEANSRALDLVYGPRQLRVLDVRADIQLAMGDNGNARSTLEKAILVAEGMPKSQRSPRAINNFKKKLDAIPKS